MILGMTTHTFTVFHVVLSLIGIAAGLVVMFGLLSGKRLDGWTALFLVTTIATSVTGFFFHSAHFGPPHYVGILSLIVLAIALVARYGYHLAGAWRSVWVITAAIALYLNVFVGVVQAFQKIAALKALAPTQSEPPFAIAQLLVLVLFITLTVFATRRFHVAAVRTA
ncbi:MAG: hypothetical protein JWO56_151 [Acidobacteria bacterium]|nr:hypothetical protein [Acidobacteriota bacterium]